MKNGLSTPMILEKNWLNSSSQKGYNSFGNGAAMRVSYIGWHYPTLEEVGDQAVLSALVTHNHPEGVKAAQATAEAVFLARTGSTKKEIVRHPVPLPALREV